MISPKNLKKLPDAPGVYFFKNAAGQMLYIGKATSLKDRTKSYFSRDLQESRGPLIVKMINEATRVDFIKTDSVLEALILEANLIKKFQPPYNTKEKDDRSFNFIIITKEDFPRVLLMRGHELEMLRSDAADSASQIVSAKSKKFGRQFKTQAEFGPFTRGGALAEALKIVRKIFPYRDKCKPGVGRPCFNRQIGLCPGVCSSEISKREYSATIKHIKLFFEGKKKRLIKNLQKEMCAHAKTREFEKAAKTKRTIFALEHIQDIALLKATASERNGAGADVGASASTGAPEIFRIEAYDVAHMAGSSAVGVMTVVEGGEAKRSDYRKFRIRGDFCGNDTAALKEILRRRLAHSEWPLPDAIVVDGGKAQINAAESVLAEGGVRKNSRQIAIVSVVKDERHRPREILGKRSLASARESEILIANSEAHRFAIQYHRSLRGKAGLML